MCANGAPHRKFVPREDARSPTVTLEALVASLLIDVKKGRYVNTNPKWNVCVIQSGRRARGYNDKVGTTVQETGESRK